MKGYMVLTLLCLAPLQIIVDGRKSSSSSSRSSSSGVSQGCSKGELYENDCYLLVPTSVTFHEAELDCSSRNGSLVSINNAQANDFIANLAGGGEVKAWIGATDEETEGVWKWPNGDTLEFTSWASGQPNSYKGRQNCAATNHEGTLETLEAKLTDLEDALAHSQTKIVQLENCLADISSPDCPAPRIGCTGVAGGIQGNAAALADKCDASTCSSMQEEIAKLKPKLNLVVIGGLDNHAPPDIISPSGVCQDIPPLPDSLDGSQAVYIDNKLMVCGGQIWRPDLEPQNSCQVLDGSRRQWNQGPTMNEARARFTITKAGQDLYALGGLSKEAPSYALDSMEKFTGSSGEWTTMNQTVPTPRSSHCTVFMKTTNSLVVMGGYYWNKDVDELSLTTSTWNQLAPMPMFLKALGCVVLDQTIVAGGGDPGGYDFNNKVYQLADGIWQTIGQLEVARNHATMATLDDKLLMIGGYGYAESGYAEFLDSIEEMQEDGSFRLSKLKLSMKKKHRQQLRFLETYLIVDHLYFVFKNIK